MRNIIGNNVRAIRTKKNITQGQLSGKLQVLGLNIDRPMISKIENLQREVTDFEVLALSKALDVSILDLYGGASL